MITQSLPQFSNYEVSVSMFENVSNAQDLRSKIAGLPYAFIDARMVCSMEQLYSAIYRVLSEVTYNKLCTKTLHSECLLCLSPTSNIGEAFKRFGLKDTSNKIISVFIIDKLAQEEPLNSRSIGEIIEGDEIELNNKNLKGYDETMIRKVC